MFQIDNTLLLVIDVQGKLAHAVHDHAAVLHNIQRAIQGAKILELPILWTEQVPEKIGATVPEIADQLKGLQPIEKISFSCCPNARFMEELKQSGRKQILIAGIETHVCIYQTVCDLLQEGYEVNVIVDCVSSRTKENKGIALERIRQVGGALTTLEMIITELMRGADHPKFKEIIKLIK